MAIYNECVTTVLSDGRVIVSLPNGYIIRTLTNDFGVRVYDTQQNNHGPIYWKNQAMKRLNAHGEDVAMQCKGKTFFMD